MMAPAGSAPQRPYDGAPTLDDALAEARQRRDEGTRAASLNTWGPWRRRAEAELERLARSGREFTSDDLVDAVGLPVASSTNAVGALFRAAARRRLIVTTGATTSRRASRAGGLVRTWRGADRLGARPAPERNI